MKFIRLLKRELASEALRWVEKGLLSRDQAQGILGLYETELPDDDPSAAGYNVLMGLAALFAGLALIVLVSANWEDIPRGLRMGGLFTFTAAINFLGVRAFQQDRPSAGTRWFILGAISYGTSIMLIGQIYHLGEYYSNGVYWWILGILPFALLTRSIVLMLLTQILGVIWTFYDLNIGSMPWSLIVLAGLAFYFSLALRNSLLVFLGAMLSLNFWLVLLSAWSWGSNGSGLNEPSFETAVFATACGISSMVLGCWMAGNAKSHRLQVYGGVLRLWGLRGAIILLLVMTFQDPWEELFDQSFAAIKWLWISLAMGLGSWLVVLGLELKRGAARSAILSLSVTGIFIVFWAAAMLAVEFLPASPTSGTGGAVNAAIAWQVAGNLIAVCCGIAFIMEALQETSTASFYMGVGLLLLVALFRYFDLVGDYVGAAILFMVCAGIMMGAARFWRRFSTQSREAQP